MMKISIPSSILGIALNSQLFGLLCISHCIYGVHSQNRFLWTNRLRLAPEIELKWDISDSEWLTAEVSTTGVKGYVGIGFSPSGGMPGSDIILGWFDTDKRFHLHDYHANSTTMPKMDLQQDVELIEVEQANDGFRFVFRRKWDTCDPNDFKIQEDTTKVIWAWSNETPRLGRFEWHGRNRGVQSASLRHRIGGSFRTAEEGEKHWDVHLTNHSVGEEKTHYFCKLFKFPKLVRKHHIIAYLPIINKEHRRLIHHIALFQCNVPNVLKRTRKSMFEHLLQHPGDRCHSEGIPSEFRSYCYTFEIALNYGSEGQDFPDHVGRPIGEDPDEDNYFVLEVHYENIDGVPFMDSSGVKVVYTEKLRPYDSGAVVFGQRVTPFTFIPPKQEKFKIKGFCSGVCTQKGLPENGIKVFSTLLHGHVHARSLVLRHIRNGVELPPLAQDNHYDYNYQQYKRLPQEVVILPDDEIIVECDYTNDKDNYVVGGFSTRREMCLAMIIHYPKSSLVDCRSQYEFKSFFKTLGIDNVHGEILNALQLPYDPDTFVGGKDFTPLNDADILFMRTPQEEANYTVFDDLFTFTRSGNVSVGSMLKRWKWQVPRDEFASKWSDGLHYMHCASHGGRRIDSDEHIMQFPHYIPYSEPATCQDSQQRHTSGAESTRCYSYISAVCATLVLCQFVSYGYLMVKM